MKFNPAKIQAPYSLQIPHFRIEGELGERAAAAAKKAGMSHQAFIRACVQYALDNMEADI